MEVSSRDLEFCFCTVSVARMSSAVLAAFPRYAISWLAHEVDLFDSICRDHRQHQDVEREHIVERPLRVLKSCPYMECLEERKNAQDPWFSSMTVSGQ